jgi:hypothetical protein
MNLRLIVSQILGRKLVLQDGREVKIYQSKNCTSLTDLLEVDKNGFRIATRSELEMFARKYPLSRWHREVLGIGSLAINPLLGIIAERYRVRGSWVEEYGFSFGDFCAFEHILLVQDKSLLN